MSSNRVERGAPASVQSNPGRAGVPVMKAGPPGQGLDSKRAALGGAALPLRRSVEAYCAVEEAAASEATDEAAVASEAASEEAAVVSEAAAGASAFLHAPTDRAATA